MRTCVCMNPLILLVGWALLGLGFHSTAEAGFISTSVQNEGLASFSASMAGSPAPSREKTPPPSFLLQKQIAWMHLGNTPGSSGGMSSQSVGGPSGASPSAVLTAEAAFRSELSSCLGPERKIWLPPPFSTGVFRPPRFVG